MENQDYDFVRLGEYFYIDLDREIIKYKDKLYTKGNLEDDQKFEPAMKRFVKCLLDRYNAGKPVVDEIDLYVAYSTRTNKSKKENVDREALVRETHIDSRTVPKFYNRISQLIVNFHSYQKALKGEEKGKCFIKKNKENQFWYEPKEDSEVHDRAIKGTSVEGRIISQNGFMESSLINEESDDYYINVIKERALLLTGDSTIIELRALERQLFKIRTEKLSRSAQEIIDDFFAFDLRFELIKNGVSETLAALYCEIWLLWAQRLQYLEEVAEMEHANDQERLELRKQGIKKIEFRLEQVTNIVMFYNQSLDKGGKA